MIYPVDKPLPADIQGEVQDEVDDTRFSLARYLMYHTPLRKRLLWSPLYPFWWTYRLLFWHWLDRSWCKFVYRMSLRGDRPPREFYVWAGQYKPRQ